MGERKVAGLITRFLIRITLIASLTIIRTKPAHCTLF